MKKMKNNLDEMQEQKLLKIEHNGCWFAFWGLLAALVIQAFIFGAEEWRCMAGEWVVFMCLALYIGIDCMRNGIWDRRLSPTPAVNLVASLIAGVAIWIINSVLTYKRYPVLSAAVASGAFSGIFGAVICFLTLMGCTSLYKKRLEKLEKEAEHGEDDNEN